MDQNQEKWTFKDVQRLINTVKVLNLTLPPEEHEEWKNIDKFLEKPVGSSMKKCQKLMQKYLKESLNPFTTWLLLEPMKQLLKAEKPFDFWFGERFDVSSEQDEEDLTSFFSSVSKQHSLNSMSNADAMFLTQLLPDLQKLDEKSKSFFKLKTQELAYQLRFPN
ncbi:CLUMA_CG012722, isoform A [Clunio marinus]|uniref:CLUMA_CG012722, isoform A n=1 Tax=Clunio marinus TaxID=568069 RepID=A0A1J1IIV1_9DIPT|nr:CLUMA_CG012722, isoform A [Clunio marinus]